jgi:hypothetical protein
VAQKVSTKRKKVFISSKAIKFAIGSFAGFTILSGFLGLFYTKTQVLQYANDYDSNLNLLKTNRAFNDEADYLIALSKPILVGKRSLLLNAISVAREQNLLDSVPVTPHQVNSFFAALDSRTPRIEPPLSLPEHIYNGYCDQLRSIIERFLDTSQSLDWNKPEEFKLKLKILAEVSKISNTFDCQGTDSGTQSRIKSNMSILSIIRLVRGSSRVSNKQKDEVLACCLPELMTNFDLPLMFRTELLRINEHLKAEEDNKIHPKYLFCEKLKPMPTYMKLELMLPGVKAAWISRMNEEFASDINGLEHPKDSRVRTNNLFVGQKELSDGSCADLFEYFGVTVQSYHARFTEYNKHILHFTHPLDWRFPQDSPAAKERYGKWQTNYAFLPQTTTLNGKAEMEKYKKDHPSVR